MKAERWREVERIFQAAVELQPPEQEQFLQAACKDEEVRREVESLIVAHRNCGSSFIEPRQRLVGRTIGRYEVQALAGVGGMGEVYLARDTRLGRDVAIKVLPAEFAQDEERLIRFEREAKSLASLNHPNIAAIYDVEESDGIQCLVLEFVEGESLAERVKRGRIPMIEALAVCRQIADALEAAHDKGIIHRDLKPANIKITPNGTAKVLDFGLAVVSRQYAGSAVSKSQMETVNGTLPGVILGTVPYMSPEQARGQEVDKRTDIWAF